MRRRPGARWFPALLVLLVIGASGCTTASPHPGGYRERTKVAIEDAISQVGTAEKVLTAAEDGKVLATYALTTVRASDATLGTVVAAYAELYPPESLDALYTRANALLGDASDLVAATRIALYRRDGADYPRLVGQLDALTKTLEEFEATLQ